MSHDHYKKDVRHLDMIDVYRVIELFEVTHPALQHALKKILAAGNRGAKDWEKDVQEAIDSLNRALQMRAEDAGDNQLRANAAEKTLSDMGYSWTGGVLWRPPYGKKPDWLEDDPHAELRKTWKPGQRWQWRDCLGPLEDWHEVVHGARPEWSWSCEYRRHPDDAKEGHEQR